MYLPTLSRQQDVTLGQFLSRIQQVWLQSFLSPKPAAVPKLKSPVYTNIFTKGSSAMWNATASSRIWIRVTDFISYDDNRYTMRTT